MYKDPEKKKAYDVAYRTAHREEQKAYSRAYAAAHPEEKKNRNAVYRATNRRRLKVHKAAYYLANLEEERSKRTAYRATHKLETRERDAVYRAAHRAAKNLYNIAYYQSHLEESKTYKRAYNASHREAHRIAGSRRRAMKKGLPATLTADQWEAIKVAYRHRCAYCGENAKALTQDHVVSLVMGGGTTSDNIVPACKSCNSSKGPRMPINNPELRLMI